MLTVCGEKLMEPPGPTRTLMVWPPPPVAMSPDDDGGLAMSVDGLGVGVGVGVGVEVLDSQPRQATAKPITSDPWTAILCMWTSLARLDGRSGDRSDGRRSCRRLDGEEEVCRARLHWPGAARGHALRRRGRRGGTGGARLVRAGPAAQRPGGAREEEGGALALPPRPP